MALIAKEREVVVPGMILAEGMDYLPSSGTYRIDDKIMADQLGLLMVDRKVLKIIPLSGRYLPKRNDIVVGKVVDIASSGWRFDINSPYTAMLMLKEASYQFVAKTANLSKFYAIEDWACLKVVQVTTQNLIDLSAKGPGLRKLQGGQIIEVNTHKVPRIIGKKGSMVSMLKKATDCKIIVGQNGKVWINGDPKMEVLVVNTIKKIERESHIKGLTDRIKQYLEKKLGKTIDFQVTDDRPDEQTEEQNV
ncbi:MAG: exosome complex protein Rrp4 [Nanoarchaeota archaeon]|nr:exosome complex protein Rrp4 [Nanoarchaeota archaeon]